MEPKKEISVGGQAVIEGVMMRGPDSIATALRRKDGTIELYKQPFASKAKKGSFLGLPLVRGFVSLIEMMVLGIKTITLSANRAELDIMAEQADKGKELKKKSKAAEQAENLISYVFAFGLAFVLFAWLPYRIADWIGLSKQNFYFNLFAGSIRIVFFVLYIWLISRLKDIHRLFQYHGAEHKNINAYEKETGLDIASIQSNTTIHPRCGTSFIFFVLMVSILLFSIIDTLVSLFVLKSQVPLALRLGYHLLLFPLVSGVSYEILKFSGKNLKHPVVKILTIPGMALQHITTQPPDDQMVEIALVAMKAALDMDLQGHNVKVMTD
jgi:uncharacterized protein YqhQ